ncbi:MAG: hypothetical protein U1C46_11245 [Bacteroidales bacterium]|nr:hypothetical protein [Bacteroidales bacterium]MDZ4205376.1 hypothetical protein [Bacteroidales bacterium]
MIKFIDIPTEQTTAITDVVLAIVAFTMAVNLISIGRSRDKTKARIWAWAFSLLAFAAFMGFIAHGFQMSARLNYIFWQPLNLALGLAIAFFVIGVMCDYKRTALPVWLSPAILAIAVLFYVITLLVPGSFFVFIIYEAIAMLFALVVYSILAIRRRLRGAWLMSAGILITMIAAAIQASEAVFITLIWDFDFNGIFHIVQIPGLIFLWLGLRNALLYLPVKK